MQYHLSEDSKLRLKIVFIGLCISLIAYFSNDLINRDGVLYLQTAHAFEKSGFSASIEQYSWPFYSIAIAFFHSITPLNLENSAHLLNALLLLILTDAFVRFYWEINSKVIYRWMPAAILLSYIGINDYRYIIVRDWGYWAFLFQALYYFIKAYKTEKLIYYVLWQFFIILALLFRIESIVIIVLLPLTILAKKLSVTEFIKSGCFFLLPIVVLFLIDLDWYKSARVQEVFSYLDISSFINQFNEYSYNIGNSAFYRYNDKNSIQFTISGILGFLLIKTISKIGILYIGIAIIGFFRYKKNNYFNYSLVNLLIVTSFVIVFVFFCNLKIISGRYLIQISLMLLLYITYYSEQLLKEINGIKAEIIVASLIIVNLLSGLHHTTSSKGYIKEMGEWIIINMQPSSSIYTTNKRLYYYSGGIENENITLDFNLRKSQFVLLTKQDTKQYTKYVKKGMLSEYHTISGSSGDAAILYKINK